MAFLFEGNMERPICFSSPSLKKKKQTSFFQQLLWINLHLGKWKTGKRRVVLSGRSGFEQAFDFAHPSNAWAYVSFILGSRTPSPTRSEQCCAFPRGQRMAFTFFEGEEIQARQELLWQAITVWNLFEFLKADLFLSMSFKVNRYLLPFFFFFSFIW